MAETNPCRICRRHEVLIDGLCHDCDEARWRGKTRPASGNRGQAPAIGPEPVPEVVMELQAIRATLQAIEQRWRNFAMLLGLGMFLLGIGSAGCNGLLARSNRAEMLNARTYGYGVSQKAIDEIRDGEFWESAGLWVAGLGVALILAASNIGKGKKP